MAGAATRDRGRCAHGTGSVGRRRPGSGPPRPGGGSSRGGSREVPPAGGLLVCVEGLDDARELANVGLRYGQLGPGHRQRVKGRAKRCVLRPHLRHQLVFAACALS